MSVQHRITSIQALNAAEQKQSEDEATKAALAEAVVDLTYEIDMMKLEGGTV